MTPVGAKKAPPPIALGGGGERRVWIDPVVVGRTRHGVSAQEAGLYIAFGEPNVVRGQVIFFLLPVTCSQRLLLR